MKRFLGSLLTLAFLNMYIVLPAISADRFIEVKEGTRIPITVKSEYTSKNIEAGQKIDAIIDEDVVINSVTVFKQGANATIKVSDVKKAGFIGNAGEIMLINGDVIDAKGDKHSIEYNQKLTGEEKTWPKVVVGFGAVASLFLVGIPLLLFSFVKGGQAKVSPGKVIEVSVKNDFKFIPEKL